MTSCPGSLLIVDDDEFNRDMLSQRLELNGYAVTAVDGGGPALELVRERPFDLVLLDVMMPEINGLEVLRRIRTQHAPTDLPVIMVTAKDQSSDIVDAFGAGANDYVTKPLDFPVVLARVATQITAKRARAALSQSEERYALAARGANDGLWDWDLVAGSIYYSPRWKAMLGLDGRDISAGPDEWYGRVHTDDLNRVQAHLASHLQGTDPHFECEHRLLHEDQSYRWMLARGVAVRNANGRCTRIAGSLTDITEAKVVDPLTGLPNRVHFMDRVERAIDRSQREPGYRYAVLFLDLDRFKVINDSLGHLVGDQLLTDVARRLDQCLRASDTIARPSIEHTIARMGGDEFTILLDDINERENAAQVAERIAATLSAPFKLGRHMVYTSVSLGIAIGSPEYERADDLLRDADTALYSAKSHGKSRYEVFDSAMHAQAVARLALETDLRRGIDRKEFRLHYQPIVELKSSRLIGFEALLRWQHPERGLIGPVEFLDIAEETGLIVPLGWWVLEEACRQVAAWRARFSDDLDLVISVNLSSKQFLLPGLVEEVERRIRDARLEPRYLKLEITETAIISDIEAASAMLTRLRELGVSVSIDDFGTGYSSLSYLRRFPIDTLKIDRSFIHDLETEKRDSEIVRTIVSLAQTLSIDVVAEGVETLSQRDRVRELGCEHGQGFYFSHSVEGSVAEELLAQSLEAGSATVGECTALAPGAEPQTVDACASAPLPR